MTDNARRAIAFAILAAGIILLVVGATTSAYDTMTGVIIFLCCLFASITLKMLWGLKK